MDPSSRLNLLFVICTLFNVHALQVPHSQQGRVHVGGATEAELTKLMESMDAENVFRIAHGVMHNSSIAQVDKGQVLLQSLDKLWGFADTGKPSILETIPAMPGSGNQPLSCVVDQTILIPQVILMITSIAGAVKCEGGLECTADAFEILQTFFTTAKFFLNAGSHCAEVPKRSYLCAGAISEIASGLSGMVHASSAMGYKCKVDYIPNTNETIIMGLSRCGIDRMRAGFFLGYTLYQLRGLKNKALVDYQPEHSIWANGFDVLAGLGHIAQSIVLWMDSCGDIGRKAECGAEGGALGTYATMLAGAVDRWWDYCKDGYSKNDMRKIVDGVFVTVNDHEKPAPPPDMEPDMELDMGDMSDRAQHVGVPAPQDVSEEGDEDEEIVLDLMEDENAEQEEDDEQDIPWEIDEDDDDVPIDNDGRSMRTLG